MICCFCKKDKEFIGSTYLGKPVCTECASKMEHKYCGICSLTITDTFEEYKIIKIKDKYYRAHLKCSSIYQKLIKDKVNISKCPKCNKRSLKGIFHRNCFSTSTCKICNIFTLNKERICKNCLSKEKTCIECNTKIYRNCYDLSLIYNNKFICSRCYDRKVRRSIRNYSTRANSNFFPERKNQNTIVRGNNLLYLGVELEVECTTMSHRSPKLVAYGLNKNFNTGEYPKFLTKSDASIRHGFEITSYPAILEEHTKYNWKKVLKYLRKVGCLSHNTKTCGIHIHINKAYFKTRANRLKFTMFIHSLRKIMFKFARRGGANYAKFKKVVPKYKYQKANYNTAHDDAVHFTPNTIELRIFKGTLKHSTFMANLEFCDALTRFCIKTPINKFTKGRKLWEGFLKFIKHKKEYQYLNKYILTLNITEEDFLIRKDRDNRSSTISVPIYHAKNLGGNY